MKKIYLLVIFSCLSYFGFAARNTIVGGGGTAAGTLCTSNPTPVIDAFTLSQYGTNASATLNGIAFTTTGTYVAADITGFTLYYNTTNSISGATSIGTVTTGLGTGAHSFSGLTQVLNSSGSATAGTAIPYYFFIVPTMAASPVAGHTIAVSAIPNTDVTMSAGVLSGSATAGGIQTIAIGPGAISGAATVCGGATSSYTEASTGGTWSVTGTTGSTITSSGVLTAGATAGTAAISYTSGSCAATYSVGIGAAPAAITPAAAVSICVGATTTLVDATTGGTWSSSATATATVGASSGIVTGVAAGSVTISYTTSGCAPVTKSVTVNTTPAAITGATFVCGTGTTTLADAVGTGTWTSSNTAAATVGSSSGIVTGVAAGTTVISYTIGTCYKTYTVTDNVTPAAISGASSLCQGLLLSESWESGVPTVPGTLVDGWNTTATSAAYITAATTGSNPTASAQSGTKFLDFHSFNYSGISAAVISPSFSLAGLTGSATLTFYVYRDFTAYTGASYSAEGFTVLINTTNSLTGATTLGFVPRAADDAISGSYITGTSAPGASGWYLYTCTMPTGFTGATNYILFNANSQYGDDCYLDNIKLTVPTTITLTDGTTGGTWSSSSAAIATITAGGVVTGVSPGTATITYNNGGCYVTKSETIYGYPTPITGPAYVGNGLTATLTDGVSGGTWTSSNTAIESVGASTGIVTGNSVGTAVITYSTGCGTAALDTLPVVNVCTGTPVAGTASISPAIGGSTTSFTLTDAGYTVAGGISFQWQSSPDSTTWTGITGATNATYTFTGITANKYFRCQVTCSTSSTTSNTYAVMATFLASPTCTVVYEDVPANPYAMNQVSMTGFSGSSLSDAFTPNSAGYLDRTSTVSPITLQWGNSYTGSVAYNTSYEYYENQIWIDFNNNGTFETSEAVSSVFGAGGCTVYETSDAFTINVPVGVATGYHRMRVRNAMTFSCSNSSAMDPCAYNDAADYYYYGSTVDYIANIVAPPACSGTPTAGTAVSTATTVTTGTSFTLSPSGSTVASGMSYQWQSSTTGTAGSFANITGATSPTYGVTSITATKYYRYYLTCTSSAASDTSAYVKVTFLSCIPTYYYSNPASSASFNAVSLTGYSGTLSDAFTPVSSGYTALIDRTSVTPVSIRYGDSYTGSITYTTTGSYYVQSEIWIDFNDDNVFATSEAVAPIFGTPGVGASSASFTVTIPAGVNTGTHRMRIRAVNSNYSSSLLSAMDPCTSGGTDYYYYGDAADYLITVVAPAACSGTPTGGTAASTLTSVTTGTSFNLSVTGATVASGITYQWQVSTSSATDGFSNISGATGSIYTVSTESATSWYRRYMTCTSSAGADTSVAVKVQYLSCIPTYYYTNPTIYAFNAVSLIGYSGTLSDAFTPVSSGYTALIDRTSVMPITVQQTGTYSGTLTYSSTSTYDFQDLIWIDFNDDNIFQTTETVTPVFGTPASGVPSATFTMTIPSGAAVGTHRMRIRGAYTSAYGTVLTYLNPCTTACAVSATSYIQYYGDAADYLITVVALPSCSGTPSAGSTASTSTLVTSGTAFTLSLTGATLATGNTYQWQSAPTLSSSFTNITGATNTTYTVSSESASTYYQCLITCTTSTLSAASTPVQVQYLSCIPTYVYTPPTSYYSFDSLHLTGYSGTLADGFTPAYSGYTALTDRTSVTPITLQSGNSYTGYLTYTTPSTYYLQSEIWIDLNDNNIFESSEAVTPVFGTPSSGITTQSFTMTVPYVSVTGTHRMRVRAVNSNYSYTLLTSLDPCTSGGTNYYYYGDAADYLITVNAPPACTGTPTAGIASATVSGGCSYPTTLSLSGTTYATGLTYQWYKSTDGVTFSAVTGATNSTYSTTVTSTSYYYSIVTCTASGFTNTSNTDTLLVPGAITGASSVCNGSSTTLSNVSTGSWTSDNTAVATVSSAGVVTGVSVGAVTISFTTSCGTATKAFTVTTQPGAITGATGLCTSSTTTLSDTTASGTWSTSVTTYGSIDPSTGVFTSTATTGTETVTYTLGSCYSTAPISVGSGSPAAITGSSSVCVGSAITLADATGGGGWSSSNTAVATVSTAGVVRGIGNGTATISYNSGCGTPSYSTKSVTVNGSAVNITYSSGGLTGAVCAGGTLSINSGTTSGGTYSWSGPNSFTSTAQNPTIASVTPAASGVYTLSVTLGGCTSSDNYAFIAVDSLPYPSVAVSNATICTGGTSILTSTVLPNASNTIYQVNAIPYQLFDTTGTSIGASDDGTATVALPFTFSFYNTSVDTVFISYNGYINTNTAVASDYITYALPSTSAPRGIIALFWQDLYTPSGGNIKYTTVGTAPNRKFVISYNNVPDISGTGINNGQIVLYEGTNVIETYVTKANTGGSYTPVNGIQNPARTLATVVPGRNNVNYTVNSPTGYRFSRHNYTYAWSPATALSSTTGSVDTSTGLTATQVYTLTVVDANSGCTTGKNATATVNVVAQPAITLSATPLSLCSGGSETLVGTRSGGTGTATYTWSGPGLTTFTGTTATPTAFTPTVTTTTTGAYSVSLAYTGSGCTTATASSAAVTINAQPTVTVSSSATSICNGGTQVLTAATTGGSGTATYTWRGPGIATTTSSSPSATFTPTVATTTTGAYSVSVSFSGSGCLPATNVTGIDTVNANPDITVGASPAVCQGVTSANLTYTGATGAPTTYSIVYSTAAHTAGFADVTSATLPASPIVLSVPAAAAPATYSGTVTVYNACASTASHGFNVTVNTVPTASVTSATTPCTGTTATLTLSGTPGATVTYSYNGGTSATFNLSGAGSYSYVTAPVTATSTFLLSMVSNVSCNSTPGVTTTINPVNQVWNGTTSTDWNTASNWACGSVPVATENVLIPSGTTYAPELMSASTGATDSLTINAGAVVTLDSPAMLNIAGNLINNSTISGAGTVVLNGTAAQLIRGNGYVYNMTLNNTAGATINSSSDTLKVKNTLTLTAGTLITNNSLVLAADSVTTGNIAAIPTGAGISGNLTTMSYVFGHRAYRFWAHPFTASIPLSQIEQYIDITGAGGAANGFTPTITSAPSAYWYNPLYANSSTGSDPGWRGFTSALGTPDSNNVHRFQGFRLFARGAKGTGLDGTPYTPVAATVGMYGTVNTGDAAISLQKGTGAHQDYNMIGNPYPSPVDIGAAVYAAGANITGGYYYVWDPYLGTSSTGAFIVKAIDGSSYYLGNNQSFQVRAASSSSVLTFHESNKGTKPSTLLLKSNPDYLSLYIYDADRHLCDMTYLKFNDQATDNEDEMLDAQKAVNPSINFYTKSADGSNLAIDQRPYDENKVIALGLTTSVSQPYIIKVDNLNIPAGGQVYLHDKMLETYTLLQKGTEYAFDVTNNSSTQGNRFELNMKRKETAAIPAASLNVQMTPNPATDAVNITYTASTKEQTDIRVMTVSGAVVINQDLGMQLGGTISMPVSKLASGVYMVELTHGAGKIVQRLVKD